MPRRANTQTQQEAVQENAAVQANAGADMQMEATITKTQPEKGVLALADVKIGDFMTIPVSYTHLTLPTNSLV